MLQLESTQLKLQLNGAKMIMWRHFNFFEWLNIYFKIEWKLIILLETLVEILRFLEYVLK